MSPGAGRPPRAAEWVIARTVPPGDRDAALGDLEETFRGDADDAPEHPRLWYWGAARSDFGRRSWWRDG